jgi:predicted ester cyclase
MGKAEVGEFYRAIFAALSDIELEIHEIVESDGLLGCRFTMHGTHTGELAGTTPTVRRIQQPGMTILRFSGDRAVERWHLSSLGSVPSGL